MVKQKLYLLILVGIFCISIHSQLLAIDFGTQYIKAALVHSGAGKSFSIVENSKSQRKFINALGFFNQERFYQSDSLPKRTKVPQNCFLYSRMLIDLVHNPNLISVVKKDLFLQYINENNDNQFLAEFILKNFPKDTNEVTLLEVITMILKYVKTQAQKFAKSPIKDVVLVLPNYWTIHQRNFLLQAATVAEIYILSIISQNTAASINYALTQRNQNNTQTVLFYNVGSNSLQMTLVQYKQVANQEKSKPVESIFVLDDYGKPYVGGLRLDSIISKYFQEIFEQKYKKKLDKKGLIKLLGQSSKVKQTLTSNKQASIFVQGIMDGIDFHGKLTRSQFEKRAQQVFKELTAPLKRFLLDNDLKADDLHSVELIGGGTRIPKLQSMIAEILNNQKQKIGTHINGDESMALGGAFFAANSSKKFKVKGINLYDGFNFDIRLVLRNLDQTIQQSDPNYFYKNATIFKKKSRYGLNKQVSFKCTHNIRAQLYRVDPSNPQQQQLLKSYQLDQVQSFNETDFKLSLIFTIDPLEVVQLKESKFTYKKDEIQSYLQKVKKVKVRNATKVKDEEIKIKEQEEESEESTKQENDQQQQRSTQQATQQQQSQQQQATNNENEQQQQQQAVNEQQKSQEESIQQQKAQQQDKWSQQQQQQKQQKQTGKNKQSEQKQKQKQKTVNNNKTAKGKNKKAKKQKQQQQFQYETVARNKTVTKKYQKDLKVKQSYNVKKLQENLNQRTREMLRNYEKAQEKKRALAEARNKLQACIYQTNDKLQNQEFIRYSKEQERQHLKKLAEQKQEWHDESTSKNPQDYKKQYNELHKPLDKVKRRIIEHYERDHIKDRALAIIRQHLNLTQKIQKGKQWITDQQVKDLKQSFQQARNKIRQMFKSMQNTAIYQDPQYQNKDMIKQAQNVKDKYFTLKAKPKPKQEKKKQEKKKQEKSSSQSYKSQQESKEDKEQVNEDQL